ncbi:GGDEF domain-containing protein [Aliirhizobium smilacinae]|uniref:diguanylate cyclase n=1 Tax=Aliirhizobium smilacinae TaxID=1395944 RepID=A0A5C4XK38_9HYPH|nr:sensor domain-containing diguanylate cyclase [Rhizobium smilacinae]TNM62874.1 diguanylate cyclase [Rhizobium smilacinae]
MTKRASIASLIPASQDIYRKIVFEIADGIIGIDDHGIIRLCNPATESIFGWKSGELLDKPLEVLLPERVHGFHQKLVASFQSGNTEARYMGQRSATIAGRRLDGTEINLGITILRTSAAGSPMMVAVIRDISDHVRYQNDLKRLAETDSLSGLLNRRAFRANVLQSVSANATSYSSMVIFDLDGFKGVNDRFGHDAGDEVITCFSDVLRNSIRATDIAGRWGGEEFVLFLPNLKAREAIAIVERIRANFSGADFNWQGHPSANFTVSAGLAIAAPGCADLSDMIASADKALYEAKRAGRDQLVCLEIQQEALAS